jgi:hypothetical protein
MTRKIVPALAIGEKDSNGSYLPLPEPSIDALLKRGLKTIDQTMRVILHEVNQGAPSRECIQNLKDCMSMLKDLKEREADILDELSIDELKKAADDNS